MATAQRKSARRYSVAEVLHLEVLHDSDSDETDLYDLSDGEDDDHNDDS